RSSPLFPYTTLFRSAPIVAFHPGSGSDEKNWPLQSWIELGNHFLKDFAGSLAIVSGEADEHQTRQLESIWQNPRVRRLHRKRSRSEEHTSELQSRGH